MLRGGGGENHRPPRAMSLPRIPCPQALGEIPYDPQSKKDQRTYQTRPLQNGNAQIHPPPPQTGGLDRVHRPEGCLSPRPYRTRIKGPIRLYSGRGHVPLQGSAFRPQARTAPVHKTGRVRGGLPQTAGPKIVLLSGRLASGGRVPRRTVPAVALSSPDCAGLGLSGKLEKIGARAHTASDLLRSRHRSAPPTGAAEPGTGEHDRGSRLAPPPPAAGPSQGMAPISGVPGQPSRCAPGLPAAHASPADTSAQALQPIQGPTHAASAYPPDYTTAPCAMVAEGFPQFGEPPTGGPVFHYSDHRCLPAGMGWPLPGQCGLWRLATYGHTLPHQCAGVLGCPSVTPFLSTPAPPAHSSHSYRQCDCSGVHKQAGGHALHQTECPSGSSVEVVQTGGNFSHSVLHPGPGQSHSRLPIPGSSSALGVDPPPDGHGPDNTDSRTTASGPIRVGTQCPPPQVLLQGSRPSSLEDRRVLLPVEGVPGLCLPADLPHSAHTTEDSGGSSAGGADSTLVAEEELVPRTGRPTSRSPEDPAPALRPNSTADISDAAPSAERVAPDCVALIRRAGTQAGLSDRAAALIASSRRVSTCETYNSRLAGYFHWCESHGVEPRSAPAHHIADFLITLFDKGRLISTIRGHRSAIAAIHSGFADGTCVSTAPCLSDLLRALFLKRPPVRKLLPSWSLPAVLEALTKAPFEPLAEASLRNLTIKTVFLVAIASGQRRSALHALSSAPGHIRWERTGVRLIPNPSYIAKNQTASSAPVEIFIQPISAHSSISEDKVWCPVRALKYYWHRTQSKRSGDQLFVITKEPFSPASRDTISKWIVAAIRAAGDEALAPGVAPHAHDTRSVSTSWALFSGVSVEEIHRAAYWRSPNSFISFYLRDIPAAEPSFSRAALSAAAQSL